MKKRIFSLILAVMMVSSIMSLMVVSVSAASKKIVYRSKTPTVSAEDIHKQIARMNNEETLDVYCDTIVFSDDSDQIDIATSKRFLTINFHNVEFVNDANDPLTDSFFEINGYAITLNFDNCKITTMVNGKSVIDWYGSAIYVDGHACTIDGRGTTEFDGCGTTKDGGGAIYVSSCAADCHIRNCIFRNGHIDNEYPLQPSKHGRGAYIFVTQIRCRISYCYFDVSNWKTPNFHVHSCVFSTVDEETKGYNTQVINCGPNKVDIADPVDKSGMYKFRGCEVAEGDPNLTPTPLSAQIEEGDYIIYTKLDTAMPVVIEGGSSSAGIGGKHAILWRNGDAKVFTITKNAKTGTYILKNKATGLVLAVSGASKNDHTPVVQWFYSAGSADHHWVFDDAGNGSYYIRTMGSHYMTLKDSAVTNGAAIEINCFNGETNQMFKLVKADANGNPIYNDTGSTLSQGNIWIIVAVAVVVIVGVAALVIVKKKKKPALADGVAVENEDNE